MTARLSHGLPRLATDGNRIIRRDSGKPLLLRGVNRSGLEYAEPQGQDFLEAARLSEAEIRHITEDWGANIIRLPFNQGFALNGRRAASPDDYLRALDQVVDWAAAAGAYTLLDLQWLSADANHGRQRNGGINRVAPLPDSDSQRLWRILARRYQGEPAVLFDLYNEPHHTSADVWRLWAGMLTGIVREEAPQALVFVSGVDWGYDLRGVPLPETGIVYSTHVYPWKRLSWKKAFGWLADDLPVFAAEWGGSESHLDWGGELAGYLRGLGIGWTAWGWTDWPPLVSRAETERWNVTPFGELVRRELQISP